MSQKHKDKSSFSSFSSSFKPLFSVLSDIHSPEALSHVKHCTVFLFLILLGTVGFMFYCLQKAAEFPQE